MNPVERHRRTHRSLTLGATIACALSLLTALFTMGARPWVAALYFGLLAISVRLEMRSRPLQARFFPMTARVLRMLGRALLALAIAWAFTRPAHLGGVALLIFWGGTASIVAASLRARTIRRRAAL